MGKLVWALGRDWHGSCTILGEMRLLLSSADRLQIERLAGILSVASIRTHVRSARVGQTTSEDAEGGEVWVNSERDYEAAVMLFGGAVPASVTA